MLIVTVLELPPISYTPIATKETAKQNDCFPSTSSAENELNEISGRISIYQVASI